MLVGLAACALILLVDTMAQRPLRLLWHDEFQFHLQSQLLARFRLWMPAHPLTDFFDTFYVLVSPVYAPQAFPGAALLFLPTVWLHLPTWLMPLLVTGVTCGLLWHVLAELVNRASASAAVFAIVCTPPFARLATTYMGHVPVLMLGLCAIAALLAYLRTPRARHLVIIGVSLGWAAITRPLDAACYGVIVAIGLAWAWKGLPVRTGARAALLVIAGAAPFLAVQAVFDKGVTGSMLKTPFALYNEHDQPALAFAGTQAARAEPASRVPQKGEFYSTWTLPSIARHGDPARNVVQLWRDRLPVLLPMLGPLALMIPIALVGLLGLTDRRRVLLFALFPLFVIGYTQYPLFLYQYATFALPAIALTYALAPEVIARLTRAHAQQARVAMLGLIVALSVTGVMRDAQRRVVDPMNFEAQLIQQRVTEQVSAPAIVLFTAPQIAEQMHFEPVYNDDVAWPDHAPIIRAHDFGARNAELFRYYAARQPERVVWSYNRSTGDMTRLGAVTELAGGVLTSSTAGARTPSLPERGALTQRRRY
jgi:hypothetical protein